MDSESRFVKIAFFIWNGLHNPFHNFQKQILRSVL